MADNVLALIAATAVLIIIPGPNAALIVAGALRHGSRYGLMTVLGTTLGIAVQLLLVIGGFAVLLDAAATALVWIKWLGVMYLVYIGVRTWNEPPATLTGPAPAVDKTAFLRGLVIAVVNPKTLLFNAAFLPQFVSQGAPIAYQLPVLGTVFLITIGVGDSLWVAFAGSARRWFGRFGSASNKISGGFLVGAGVSLALARRNL